MPINYQRMNICGVLFLAHTYPKHFFYRNVDIHLQTVYNANSRFILEPHKLSSVQNSYNLPLNNGISNEQIVREVRSVYQSQQHAFRMNIMFGKILRHVETGEYNYFIPDQNDALWSTYSHQQP